MTIPKISEIESRRRWVTDQGECLWMKRSAKGPNRFSQMIRNLAPGRLYSLKFYTYDLQGMEMDPEKFHALHVALDNAELLNDLEPCVPYKSPQTDQGKWLNVHYYVFRARSDICNLSISDWVDGKRPGGAIGQEMVYDFIQIQPYLENKAE